MLFTPWGEGLSRSWYRDALVTQFQGGTAADVIHDESADLAGFVNQGYIADMTGMISEELKADILRQMVTRSVQVLDAIIRDAETIPLPVDRRRSSDGLVDHAAVLARPAVRAEDRQIGIGKFE